MSASRYRQFLKLCDSWPLDVGKKGRDIGARIRQQVASSFHQGDATKIENEKECDQKLESLQKIRSNYYRDAYHTRLTGSLNISLENLKKINSTESLKTLSEQ